MVEEKDLRVKIIISHDKNELVRVDASILESLLILGFVRQDIFLMLASNSAWPFVEERTYYPAADGEDRKVCAVYNRVLNKLQYSVTGFTPFEALEQVVLFEQVLQKDLLSGTTNSL